MMSRARFALLVVCLAAGAAGGLYIGWVAAPLHPALSGPAALHPAFKDDYLLMIATAYAGDHDLAAAREGLTDLGFANPGQAVAEATKRFRQAGSPEADLRRLEDLRLALGAPANEP